MIIVSST